MNKLVYFYTFLSFLTFSFADLLPVTSSSCEVCLDLSSHDCLETLFIAVQSLKDSQNPDPLNQDAVDSGESGITFGQVCSSVCTEYIGTSSDNLDKLSDVLTFCSTTSGSEKTIQTTSTINVETDSVQTSSEYMCSYCQEIDTEECISILTDKFILQSDEVRFIIEKDLFSVKCTDISDYYCQAYLDELFLTLDKAKRLSILLPLCQEGLFDTIKQDSVKKLDEGLSDIEGSDEGTCDMCDTMSDKDCRDYLTDFLLSLPDNIRLVVEKEIFGNSLCVSATGDDCLSILDDYLINLSDKDRLSILYDACVSGEINPSLNSNNEKCDLCTNLNSEDCLTTLTNSLSSLGDHTRVALEKAVIHESCDDLSEIECNEFIDSAFLSQSKLKRLSKLKQLCNAGLLKSVIEQEQQEEKKR